MNDINFTDDERKELFSRLDYDRESGNFTWIKGFGGIAVGRMAGNVHALGYVRISFKKYRILAHRLAWYMTHGRWPIGQIDHADGNKANNAISNLREVTPSLNQQLNNNPRAGNRTGFVGVSPARGRFKAQLKINGVARYLGQFATAEEAYAAYISAKAANLSAHGLSITPGDGRSHG